MDKGGYDYMKKTFNLFLILSAAFCIWGIADIYNYFTIGKTTLLYYNGADIIKQLIQYSLTQGIVKIVIGLCILLVVLIRNRTDKQRTN